MLPASATVLKRTRSERSSVRSCFEMPSFMNIHFMRGQARSTVKRPGEIAMAFTTVLTERFGLRHPIIQAPLAGGGDTPELVAAVSEAGAFGFIGGAYLTPPQIVHAARAVK